MIVLMAAFALTGWAQEAEEQGVVEHARTLATSGHRAEGLKLLKDRIAERPTDTDALVLYGVVNSWEGNYDEARGSLQKVLDSNPNNGDALPALINVEIWSDHDQRAEQIAREALQRMPDNTTILVQYAGILRTLNRRKEAVQTIDKVLALEPNNEQAAQMRERWEESSRLWYSEVTHTYDWFSNGGPDGQHETQVQIRRGETKIGSVIARFSRAERFADHSNQIELDAYPGLWHRSYAFLNVGYSPDAHLYPQYRLGADLYQNIPYGLELSGGFRRLSFSSKINIYTAWVGKYYGSWLFGARTYLTPDTLGTSHSVTFLARRYFGGGGLFDYIDVRMGTGASLDQIRTTAEIALLNATSFRIDINKTIHKRWAFDTLFSLSRQDRPGLSTINQYEASGSLYFMF